MKHGSSTPAQASRHPLWHTELGGFPISLYQQGQGFMVQYGLQVSQNLNYSEAALELGTSIMHAIKCGGRGG